MSFDIRDEISDSICDIIAEICTPFDVYDHCNEIDVYFETVEDYDKVMENYPCKKRICDYDRSVKRIRFDLF